MAKKKKIMSGRRLKKVKRAEPSYKLKKSINKRKNSGFDLSKIKEAVEKKLKGGESLDVRERGEGDKSKGSKGVDVGFVFTGVPGFDELFDRGIPRGSAVIVAGGAGSGKTIFCLQTLIYHASRGERCFYMSFEESEKRLVGHMKDFGWDPDKLIKSGKLIIQRFSPFDITRSVDALLAKEKGELLIELDPVILPKGLKPDIVVMDSLTAIASAFTRRSDSYRIYIEQLFRFLEKLGCTSLLITETKQIPEIFSTSGVEEFLADGVIVFYNLKREDVRENAVEILKMRGDKHQKKRVAMQITDSGIVVYPDQEVFAGVDK